MFTGPPRVTIGTRCAITKLSANCIDTKISHGRHMQAMKAITIDKSQGQTFKAVGVDMTDESFTHGMLYVALSRVGSPDCLTLLIREDCKTRNIVYSQVFV